MLPIIEVVFNCICGFLFEFIPMVGPLVYSLMFGIVVCMLPNESVHRLHA